MYKYIIYAAVVVFANLLSPAFAQITLLPGSATNPKLNDSLKIRSEPVLFAPGVMPTPAMQVAAPAFAPDGKSVYFGQHEDKKELTIVMSQRKGKTWSVPVLAPFSVDAKSLEPAFAPSGKYLIFASSRPRSVGGPKLDGHYNGQVYAGSGGNLWKVEYTRKGWADPELLPDVININSSVFSPAVAANGSLYFMRADTGGLFHIYHSQFKNGNYETALRANFCNDKFGDYDPAVAPDESFLIYSTARPPAVPHLADLFIVFRTATGWGEPQDLRLLLSENVFGVEARLSPDLKTLYFSNSRNAKGENVATDQYIWQVSIAELLKQHGIIK